MAPFKFLHRRIRLDRIQIYLPLALVALSALSGAGFTYVRFRSIERISTERSVFAQNQTTYLKQYLALTAAYKAALSTYPQIDISQEKSDLEILKVAVVANDVSKVREISERVSASLSNKVSLEQGKGILRGKASDDQGAHPAAIQIYQAGNQVAEVPTQSDGTFSYWLVPGQYQLKVSASGYTDFTQDIQVTGGQTSDVSVAMQITPPPVVATPTPRPVVSVATAKPKPTPVAAPAPVDTDGLYSKRSVTTDRGTFTVHLLSVDLDTYEMRMETAADGDCENNCPVKSLKSYVGDANAVAGIHGTYFCPTSYADCGGKTNSFYYKLYSTRLDKAINWTNGLGDYLPFLSVDRAGAPHYWSMWDSAKSSDMKTGISCRPHLVEGGQIVLTDGDMDSDKERTSKISHGFVGVSGHTVYVGIVLASNLPDVAGVVKSLGIENAFNIDGGGTSALYYNGAYKVGPGRDMPNALVFVRK